MWLFLLYQTLFITLSFINHNQQELFDQGRPSHVCTSNNLPCIWHIKGFIALLFIFFHVFQMVWCKTNDTELSKNQDTITIFSYMYREFFDAQLFVKIYKGLQACYSKCSTVKFGELIFFLFVSIFSIICLQNRNWVYVV